MSAAQRLIIAAREMRGFLAGLTPEQIAFSKAYCGDETHGDDRFRSCTNSNPQASSPYEPVGASGDGSSSFSSAVTGTPLNPRPQTSRGSSLPDAQTASAGDTAASLSSSGGDA